MRKTKIIILLLILISLALAWFNNLPQNQTQAAIEDFTRPDLCLGQAILEYHRSMNNLFNYKISLLTSGKTNTFIDTLPEVDTTTGKRKQCEKNNVTTYCLAQESTILYEAFLNVMKIHQERVTDVAAGAVKTPTIDQELVLLKNRSEIIATEIINSKNSLDLALATYQEFRLAYPLHKKFQQTYTELEKFRDKMGQMRQLVSLYRYKFVDVTTTSCQ